MEDRPSTLVFYPFAYALLDDELSSLCWYCVKRPEGGQLRRCAACKTAWFCDRRCQALGWSDHRSECRGLVACRPWVPDIEVRLLGRIVARQRQILNGDDVKSPDFYLHRRSRRSLMEVWHHEQEMSRDAKAMQKFNAIYQGLLRFYGAKRLMAREEVFRIHSRNYINRHAISDVGYLREVGKGLYLDLCAYDHSCRPNAIFTCDGFVATLRPLSSDVDLTDKRNTFYTYIDLMACRSQRRLMLREAWYFHCQCSRCTDEGDHLLTAFRCGGCAKPLPIYVKDELRPAPVLCEHCGWELPISPEAALQEMRDLDALLDQLELGSSSNALRVVEELIAEKTSKLAEENVCMARLQQARIHCTQAGDSANLLEASLKALPCLLVSLPKNHPALAYHLMSIGIYEQRCGDLAAAGCFLQDALQRFSFSLGSSHPLSLQCLTLLEENGKN